MVQPSGFTMRDLKRGLRQGEFLGKSWQSNRGDSSYRPATGISRYGPMKLYRFTVGSIVFYKSSCCPLAAVLTLLRQQWAEHLNPFHKHGMQIQRNGLRPYGPAGSGSLRQLPTLLFFS